MYAPMVSDSDQYYEGNTIDETVASSGGATERVRASEVVSDVPRLNSEEGGSLLKVEETFSPQPSEPRNEILLISLTA